VSRWAALRLWRSRDVRTPSVPFVRSLFASLLVGHGVLGGVDAIDGAGGVRMAVRSWRPSWTPDTTARTAGRNPACGRSASSTGAGGHDGRLPMLVAGPCALPFCPVRARTCRPRGWPWPAGQAHGRTLGAGRFRRLAAAVRTKSRPIGEAVTLNWGCPADRTLERSAMPVTRPATAGCQQEELIGGGGCPGGCPAAAPWRKRRPDEGGHVRHATARSSRWPAAVQD
jgi:hypothetical protein